MENFDRSALVAGGGIAGLTAAASLLREGWAVTVIEQASEFREVGAGLAITANGLSSLASLGLGGALRAAGHRVHLAGTMDDRGKWLMRIPRSTSPASRQELYGIHRQKLHAMLLGAAEGARLVTGVRVSAVDAGDPSGSPAVVRCTSNDGAVEYRADLVIAADGVRSEVRRALAPGTEPRYNGKSSWRGIVTDSSLVTDDFAVRWGPGTEFGAVRISSDQVYWYGYMHSPEKHVWDDEHAAALQHFGGWAEPVPTLIRNTPADRLLRHDVYALAPPLKTYVHGRIVLIGDAAHAMVPTMGQGANSSLEDGACVGQIGRAVNAGTSLQVALLDFDSLRRPRTQRIARRSQQTGRIGADLRGRLAIAARNALMKAVPAGPAAAAGSAILGWKAPS